MKSEHTDIEGVLRFPFCRHEDTRGSFTETFREAWADEPQAPPFVQDNVAVSQRGVVRGLHFQRGLRQRKWITVVRGRILDVALDLRLSSRSFGRHVAIELDAERPEGLLLPEGFAHGYAVLSAEAVVTYKVGPAYVQADELGIHHADPSLGIQWGVESPILSPRDQALPSFEQVARELAESRASGR